jgi:imidazolonepropionase-like amidohydrolase
MVTYGMSPLQAIQAATRNAAEALGRTGDVGAIAVGRYGDLVAVTGDPNRECPAAGGSGCSGPRREANFQGQLNLRQ